MKTPREKSLARNLHERVQELSAEYWDAREKQGMSERLAVAQTHLYLAFIEGFAPGDPIETNVGPDQQQNAKALAKEHARKVAGLQDT